VSVGYLRNRLVVLPVDTEATNTEAPCLQPLLTRFEVAAILNVTLRHADDLIWKRRLPAFVG